MVVVFCSIGGWCFWKHLLSSGKWNVSRVVLRLYRSACKIIRRAKLVAVDSEVVGKVVFQLGSFQFDSPGRSAFNSRFTKFVFGTSGAIKFVILVGGPSLITVRLLFMKYSYKQLYIIRSSTLKNARRISIIIIPNL